MTKQNSIHKYVREYEQWRKWVLRRNQKYNEKSIGRPHNRKWWKAWHKRMLKEISKSEIIEWQNED